EVAGDLCGLGGGARDAALQEWRAVAGEEGFGFVFVETHGRNTKKREAANTLRRRGSRDDGGWRGPPTGAMVGGDGRSLALGALRRRGTRAARDARLAL